MRAEDGYALILTLIALAVVSMLGLGLSFNSMTDARIAGNYESEVLAETLAEAGLNRALLELRGRAFNGVLVGPNGTAETTTAQISAYPYDFRNPLPINNANPLKTVDPRAMDITNTSQILSATVNDDGIIAAIGQTGVGYYVDPGPDGLFGTADDVAFFDNEQAPGPQAALVGRYFVKVTNNPDDAGGPFNNTDGTLIVRAMGITKSTPGETVVSSTNRRNSIAIVEAKVRMDMTFKTNSPFTVQGTGLAPAGNRFFDGHAYSINGGSFLGMSVIDMTGDTGLATPGSMTATVRSAPFAGNTTGAIPPAGAPSIANITGFVQNGQTYGGTPNPDVTGVLNANNLGNLVFNVLPSFSDVFLTGPQGCNALQGTTTDPKFVYVCGDVTCAGNNSGAGLLVVTGALGIRGSLTFNGVILVIGTGSVDARGGLNVTGGVWVTNLQCTTGGVCNSGSGRNCSFGTAGFTVRGSIGGVSNTDMINLGLTLLPLNQLGWRQIHPEMEP